MNISINLSEYHLFHAYDSTTIEFIQQAIQEYERIEVDSENRTKVTFHVKSKNSGKLGNWKLLFCSDAFDFYHFHNILCWIGNHSNTPDQRPKSYFGIAMHKNDPQQSFIVMAADDNPEKDQMQGFFRNGMQFSIYLPEAYLPGGNMEPHGPIDVVNAMDNMLKWKGLSQACFKPEFFSDAESVLTGMFSPD